MATIAQFEDEQEQQQGPETGPVGSVSAPQGTFAASQAQPSPVQTGRGSGRFTNIQDYLKANVGAGEQLAGGVGEHVTGQVQQAGGAVQQAEQQIGSQIQAEQQRVGQAGQIAEQIQADPVSLAEQRLQEVEQLRTGQTQLPQLRDQAQMTQIDVGRQIGQAQQTAGKTGTEEGRFDLLRQTFGLPGYTQGEQRLDQLFLQTEGANTLRDLQERTQREAQGLGQQFDEFGNRIHADLGQLGTDAELAQQQVLGALGQWGEPGEGALGGLYQDLQTRLADARQHGTEQFQQDLAALQSGMLTPEQAERLGLGHLDGTQHTYGFTDWQNEFNIPDFERLQKANVATEADTARLDALRRLAGEGDTFGYLGEAIDEDALGYGLQSGRFEELQQKARRDTLNELKDLHAQHDQRLTDPDYWTRRAELASRMSGSPQDQVDYIKQIAKQPNFIRTNKGQPEFYSHNHGWVSLDYINKNPEIKRSLGSREYDAWSAMFDPNHWGRDLLPHLSIEEAPALMVDRPTKMI